MTCSCLLPDRSRSASQKSPVIRRNCNPAWNHTFVFESVRWLELKDRSLELTIWDFDRLVSNDFLGGVRLNLGTGRYRQHNANTLCLSVCLSVCQTPAPTVLENENLTYLLLK